MKPLRVVCVADTHTMHRNIVVPSGDVLIIAGDFCGHGRSFGEIEDFDSWLALQEHPVKIVVAGNHDQMFETHPERARTFLRHGKYLQDSETTLRPALFGRPWDEGWQVTVYGSPWQPRFYDWAFNLDRGSARLRAKWRAIPTNVDILVTHSPPYEIMDHDPRGGRSGCELLLDELKRIKPRLHVFGHLHGTHGVLKKDGIVFVNASICDERYGSRREPIVIDLPLQDRDCPST